MKGADQVAIDKEVGMLKHTSSCFLQIYRRNPILLPRYLCINIMKHGQRLSGVWVIRYKEWSMPKILRQKK
jgi:hypothetical protein